MMAARDRHFDFSRPGAESAAPVQRRKPQMCREALRGFTALRRGVEYQPKVFVRVNDQRRMIEGDRTNAIDPETTPTFAHPMHVMASPEFPEQGGLVLQRLDKVRHIVVLRGLRVVAPETGDDLRRLTVPFDDPVLKAIIGKQHPQHVALSLVAFLEAEQDLRRRVPADHVPSQIHHIGRMRGQIVDHAAHQRRQDAPLASADRRRAMMRKQKQMPPLGLIEFQDAGNIIEKGRRYGNIAALFEPSIPGEADARERRHFLAAQARCPATLAGRQTDIHRRYGLAATAQEIRQFRARSIKTRLLHIAHSNTITCSIVTGLCARYSTVSRTGAVMSQISQPLPEQENPTSSQRPSPLGLAILLLGGFMTVFDLFVVNVAIPSMQADLGASFAEIGFVIAGYELAFGVLLIAGGRLGDRHGRRRLFSLGMIGFAVTSFLCGIAPNTTSLIVARLLQGAAGAILFPQIYALLRVMYDEAGRMRAFGLLGMTLGLAAIAGQVLGGLIVESDLFGLGWRIIFLVNLPIGIVAAMLARTIPESRVTEAMRVDWPGIGLATTGLLLLLLPLLEGPNVKWAAWTWASMTASAVLLAAFLIWESREGRKGRNPAIDLGLFRNGGFSAGSLVVLLIYSTSTSLFLCFALLVQSGLGLTPFEAGMLFAPASVGFVAASLLAPRLVARFGTIGIAGGALTYAAGIGWLIVSAAGLSGKDDASTLLPALILFGFGQGLSMTPLLNLVIGFVEDRHAGMAAGIISTMQQVGGAFGVSIVGIFFVSILDSDTAQGVPQALRHADAFAGAMIYNLIAVLAAAALITWITRRRVG